MTPTIATSDLSLRPLTKATARHVGWLNDSEVVRYSEQRHRTHTLASVAKYIRGFDGVCGHIWALVEVAGGRHIGNITAAIDTENRVAELGILIGDRAAWRKGYGTQAWSAVTDWLLAKDGGALRKVEAGCMAKNAGMIRILEHCSFAFEGERKNHFLWNNQPIGLVMFGRFA